MKEYTRTKLTVTEFAAEDVITTSGTPTINPTNKVIMNSPNYENGNTSSPQRYGWNWTLWQ